MDYPLTSFIKNHLAFPTLICYTDCNMHVQIKIEAAINRGSGICQERLRYWGDEVLVGVTHSGKGLKFVTLHHPNILNGVIA